MKLHGLTLNSFRTSLLYRAYHPFWNNAKANDNAVNVLTDVLDFGLYTSVSMVLQRSLFSVVILTIYIFLMIIIPT